MTLLEHGVDPASQAQREALIKEARRLRRRRWLFGTALTAFAVAAGIGAYLMASGPPSALHAAAPAHGSSAPGALATARALVPTRSPDLLQPSTLSTLPNGNLLILDSSRDQILDLRSNGDLSVFAGTGRLGFSGDGGPARDADLDFKYFSSAGMSVTRSGAVDFLEDGSCRIRQITPGGTIRTILRVSRAGQRSREGVCPVSAFAVSPTGVLYVATSSQVERLSTSGHLVWVAGSSGSPDFKPAHPTRSNLALEPDALAFDNAGDLYIASFALKRVYELAPTGKLTDLGVSYADQFALGPAGGMFAGTHGGLIQELTAGGAKPFYDVVPRAAGIDWGRDQGFQEDGIAVTKRGTVYVDNSQGNGYGEGTVLVRITANSHASLAPIRTPLEATLPRVGAAGFPVSTYPASRPSRGAALASCPSDVGIEPFDAAAIARARRIARTYLASQFASDIAVTDRSWWTDAFNKVAAGDIAGRNVVSGERPASNSSLAKGLTRACGQRLVNDSISITVGGYSNFAGTFYLLDRGGHPLIYDAR